MTQAPDPPRDAERQVLGAILRDPGVLESIGDLTPDDFRADPMHRHIFSAMRRVRDEGRPIDIVQVGEALHGAGMLSSVGGVAELGELVDAVGTLVGVEWYATRIREHAERQRVVDEATTLLALATDPKRPVDELRSRAAAMAGAAGPPKPAEAPVKRTKRRATGGPRRPDDLRASVAIDGDLEDQCQVLWQTLMQRCDTNELFHAPHGLVLVRPDVTSDRPRLEMASVGTASLRAYIGERVTCTSPETGPKPVSPSRDLVEYMAHRIPDTVRVLRHLYRYPVWVGEPPRLVSRGYDQPSATLVDSGRAGEVVAGGDASQGVEVLRDLLQDFPFESAADFAGALAMALTIVLRPVIDGPTPLFNVTAPTVGSGKSMLVEVLVAITTGAAPDAMTEGKDEDEWRKRIMAALLQRSPVIFVDNVHAKLNSATLAATLTARWFTDRRLNTNDQQLRAPNDATWIATGNNTRYSDDLARRVVEVRLVPDAEEPWKRTGFCHNLPADAYSRRLELLGAIHAMVAAWVEAGCPLGKAKMASFERWARVVGGVLDVAGVDGFLAGQERIWERSETSEVGEWTELFDAWWEKWGPTERTATEVTQLASQLEILGDVRGDKSPSSQAKKMGHALKRVIGRYFGARRLAARTDTHSKRQLWRLEERPRMSELSGSAGMLEGDTRRLSGDFKEEPRNLTDGDNTDKRPLRVSAGFAPQSYACARAPSRAHEEVPGKKPAEARKTPQGDVLQSSSGAEGLSTNPAKNPAKNPAEASRRAEKDAGRPDEDDWQDFFPEDEL